MTLVSNYNSKPTAKDGESLLAIGIILKTPFVFLVVAYFLLRNREEIIEKL